MTSEVTPEDEAPQRIELEDRDGRPYATTNPAEARHLVRTAGYRIVEKAGQEPQEQAQEPAGTAGDSKPADTGAKPATPVPAPENRPRITPPANK